MDFNGTLHQNYKESFYSICVYTVPPTHSGNETLVLLLLLSLLFCASLEYISCLFIFRNIFLIIFTYQDAFHLRSSIWNYIHSCLSYIFKISFTEDLLILTLIFVCLSMSFLCLLLKEILTRYR